MTNEDTSLEKYTSHTLFSKGLRVRGVFEMEQTATYWHLVPLTIAALLSHSAGLLNRGSLRAASPLSGASSHCLELQHELNCNWLQLTQTVWGTRLYIGRPPASCERRNCTEFNPSIGQGDIFDRIHLFLDWRLGRWSICYNLSVRKISYRAQTQTQYIYIYIYIYMSVCVCVCVCSFGIFTWLEKAR